MPKPIQLPEVSAAIQQITLANNIKLWMNNLAENLHQIRQGKNLGDLHEEHKGEPALIVGAGPSVANKLPILEKHGFKGIIIACDAIIRPLLSRHIIPQYVVSVDGNPIIADFYSGLKDSWKSYACLAVTVHPKVVEELSENVIEWFVPMLDDPFQSWTALTRIMHYQSKDKFILQAPGNVGATAWNIAGFLGCDPLIVVGFDLSYPATMPIEKTSYYQTFLAMVNNDVEKVKAFFHISKNPLGQEYLADIVWDFYLQSLLPLINARQQKTLNASGAGALYGKNIIRVNFEEFLQKYAEKN